MYESVVFKVTFPSSTFISLESAVQSVAFILSNGPDTAGTSGTSGDLLSFIVIDITAFFPASKTNVNFVTPTACLERYSLRIDTVSSLMV